MSCSVSGQIHADIQKLYLTVKTLLAWETWTFTCNVCKNIADSAKHVGL